MREISFRGKHTHSYKWPEGYYALDRLGHFIFCRDGQTFEVIPETVGQFTGLTDMNGTKIFEGDIVSHPWGGERIVHFQICFESGEFVAVPPKTMRDVWTIRISGNTDAMEIIGNIHDNPELLEVSK